MAAMPADSGETAGLDDVLTQLAGAFDSLVEDTCARIYAELDSYEQIAQAALESAIGRNLRTALTAVRQGHAPDPATLDGAAQTARERFDSGVPVEEIVRGFRISIALIHERFVDVALSVGLPAERLVTGSRVMWAVADAFTTRIITEYHALELDAALRDAQRRAAAVRTLLAGEMPDDPALAGIDPHARYAAVRCEVPESVPVERVRKALESSGTRGGVRALIVADGRSCLGVVGGRPTDPGAPVGLGPFVTPDDLPRSDRTARQALRLAQQLGLTGVLSAVELGWRLAAVTRPDVWRLYADRFVAPLAAEGPFGEEILAAVRAWLSRGQSVTAAADALTVHANTVRYRLRRFEEVTSADLGDFDDLVGIWWALQLGDPDGFGL